MDGEMTLGATINRKQLGLCGTGLMIWTECVTCKKQYWVTATLFRKRDGRTLCVSCSGKQAIKHAFYAPHKDGCDCRKCGLKDQWGDKNTQWKGGRRKTADGYILIRLAPDDPMIPMAQTKDRTVLEHRLVMARYLGRPLLRTETIHHRNGIKDDNRIENLELWIGNHGAGHRADDHHCPGCRCFERQDD